MYPVHWDLAENCDKVTDCQACFSGVKRCVGLNNRGMVFTKRGELVSFADDMNIIAIMFSTMVELFNRLKRESKIELEIECVQTKVRAGRQSMTTII